MEVLLHIDLSRAKSEALLETVDSELLQNNAQIKDQRTWVSAQLRCQVKMDTDALSKLTQYYFIAFLAP